MRITISVDQMSNLELRKGFVTGNFNLIDGTEPGDWDWDDSQVVCSVLYLFQYFHESDVPERVLGFWVWSGEKNLTL